MKEEIAVSIDEAMARLAAGENDALEEIYTQTRKTVYYVALSIVRERMLAEDVMQTTYLKVLANASAYRAGSNARAWIARIAKNEAIGLLRRRKREVSVDEREELALFGTQAADEYGLLIDLARRILKEKEFAVLMLSAAEGYKRREIADLLGIPLPTVTWHYGRAVAKMQSALAEREQTQGGSAVDRRQLEQELRSEAEQHTPDVYERIRSAPPVQAEKGGSVLAAARPNRWKVALACTLAAALLFLAVLLPFVLGGSSVAAVYLSIGTLPAGVGNVSVARLSEERTSADAQTEATSVEFSVEDGLVTGVRALNRGAALLVAGETFTGLSPEDASEKFVALSDSKHLIAADGIGLYVTGDDSAAIEQRVRDRLTGGAQSYSVRGMEQTELDEIIAAYDEQAMGDFEDYLERELVHLRDGFAAQVHALMETYLDDLYSMDPAAFNQKYLYLGEDCIYEDGDEDPRELEENFLELRRAVERYGDAYIFDELYDEFLEAVEELYETDDPSGGDDGDDDDHDDDDDDDDDNDDDDD